MADGTGGGLMGQAILDRAQAAGRAAKTAAADAGKIASNRLDAAKVLRERQRRERDEQERADAERQRAEAEAAESNGATPTGVGSFGDAAAMRDAERYASAFVRERDEQLRQNRDQRRERRREAMGQSAMGRFLEYYNPHLFRRAQAFVKDKEEKARSILERASHSTFETSHAAFAHLATLSKEPMEGEDAEREGREWAPLVPGRAEVHELAFADAHGAFSMPVAIPSDSPALSDPTNQNVRAQALATCETKAAFIIMQARADGVEVPGGLSEDRARDLASALRASTCCSAGDADAVREAVCTTICSAQAGGYAPKIPDDVSIEDMASDVTRAMHGLPKVLDAQSEREFDKTSFHRTQSMTAMLSGVDPADALGTRDAATVRADDGPETHVASHAATENCASAVRETADGIQRQRRREGAAERASGGRAPDGPDESGLLFEEDGTAGDRGYAPEPDGPGPAPDDEPSISAGFD